MDTHFVLARQCHRYFQKEIFGRGEIFKDIELPGDDESHAFHFAIGGYRIYRGNVSREEIISDSAEFECFSLPKFQAMYVTNSGDTTNRRTV